MALNNANNYMVQLDGLRTIAVAMVMFNHFTMHIPVLNKFDNLLGNSGVNLFFVLSGFLITLILLRSKENISLNSRFVLRQFYIRRFVRIFPLYYFIISLGLIFTIPNIRKDFYWALFYLENWVTSTQTGHGGYFTHLWSLSVEEQFYIFFPALLLITPLKYVKHFFVLLIATGLFTRAVFPLIPSLRVYSEWFTYSFTTCCLDSFGIGALLSYLFIYHKNQLNNILSNYKLAFWLMPVIAVGLYFFAPGSGLFFLLKIVSFRFCVSVFGFWLIGVAASNGFKGVFSQFLGNRSVIYAGKISYGLYVYHFFMPYVFSGFAFSTATDVQSVITAVAVYTVTSTVVASLSFYLLEKPVNSIKRYFEYSRQMA